jgi:hypothetical protein
MKNPKNSIVPSAGATNQVMGSLDGLFLDYTDKLAGITTISEFVKGKDDLIGYFTSGKNQSSGLAEALFDFDAAKAALNAAFWGRAISMTDVLECMTAAKRNEWNEKIRDHKTPDFERETVYSTVRNLLLSRGTFMAEKVDCIFRSLSGNHVTNSPQGFRQRMIIESVTDKFGYVCHSRVEYLHDLRSVIAKLQNRDEPKTWNTQSDIGSIVRSGKLGEWHDFDGGAFRVRLYKVGTAHVEIHPEISVKLNLILSSLYPMAIASNARVVSKKEKSIPLVQDILPYSVTYELSCVAESVAKGRGANLTMKDLDKKTRTDVEAVLMFLGGVCSKDYWTFPYDNAATVLQKVIRTGCLPEKVSHQFYPTPKPLAERAAGMLDAGAGDTFLEPSAGHGGLACLLPKDSTTCVEVSSINCEILKQKGFNVETADFLKWESPKTFSRILMNPPFAKGEAERHVTRACKFLREKGKIVAILPASLRNKNIVAGMDHVWSEVISNSFEDTGVNVVILELTN